MAIFDWIFNRAPTIDQPAPDPSDRAKWLDSPLPKWEPEHRVEEPVQLRQPLRTATADPSPQDEGATPTVALGDLHIAIEYTDAAGKQSSRNITAQSISFGAQGTILKAICHSRRAVRHFRIDRIRNVITSDGEVLPAEPFFRDILDIDVTKTPPPKAVISKDSAGKLRDLLQPALSILVLAARTDDDFHTAELAAIMGYVASEVGHLRIAGKFGLALTETEMRHLETMIRTMRPLQSSVAGYLRTILSQSPDRILRLCDAVRSVVRADGLINLAEETFLEDLDTLRIQVALGEVQKYKSQIDDAEARGISKIDRHRMFSPDAR